MQYYLLLNKQTNVGDITTRPDTESYRKNNKLTVLETGQGILTDL